MKYTDIKTFQAACKVLRLDPKKSGPDFRAHPAPERKALIAHTKLVIIARALNQVANGGKAWKADFGNHSQWKYYPWFYQSSGSCGFRFDGCVGWNADSDVGSRLCFISREVAEYAGKTFFKLYNEYFV